MIRLQIVGGGRMGEALLGGLLDARWAEPSELAVVEQERKVFFGINAVVVTAVRARPQGGLVVVCVDHYPALGAHVPQTVR